MLTVFVVFKWIHGGALCTSCLPVDVAYVVMVDLCLWWHPVLCCVEYSWVLWCPQFAGNIPYSVLMDLLISLVLLVTFHTVFWWILAERCDVHSVLVTFHKKCSGGSTAELCAVDSFLVTFYTMFWWFSNTSHSIQNFNYLLQFRLWNSPSVSVRSPSTLYSGKTITICIWHTNLCHPPV